MLQNSGNDFHVKSSNDAACFELVRDISSRMRQGQASWSEIRQILQLANSSGNISFIARCEILAILDERPSGFY